MNIDSSIANYNLASSKLDSLKNLSNDDKKLKEQTDNFEALFLNIMLKDAIKNDDTLYPKQAGSDIYHSMYLEQLSQNLAGNFGYSQLLFNFLKEQQNGK